MPLTPVTTNLLIEDYTDQGAYTDTARTTPATLLDDVIKGWTDQSGNGLHVTGSGSTLKYKPNGLNGFPTFVADGVSSTTGLGTTSGSWNAADTTDFIVMKITSRDQDQVYVGDQPVTHFSAYGTLGKVAVFGASNSEIAYPEGFFLLIITSSATAVTYEAHGITKTVSALSSSAKTGLGIFNQAPFKGEIAAVIKYSAALNTTDKNSVKSFLNTRYALPITPASNANLMVVEGDSIAAGFKASTPATRWSATAAAAASSTITLDAYAVPGDVFSGLTGRASGVDANYNASHNSNILFLWCGTNELNGAGTGHTSAFNNLKTYAAARKAAGWTVVIFTALPRSDYGNNTDVAAFNALLTTDFGTSTGHTRITSASGGITYGDYLIDIGSDPTLGVYPPNGTYYADGVHANDAGQALVAPYATTLLNLVVPSISFTVSESTLERGASGQSVHITLTGATSSATADWTIAVGGTGGTVTAIPTTGANPILTVTAPATSGTATITYVPSGATQTITISDTVAPGSPSVTLGTVASYNFTLSWSAVSASPSGETITYDVKKNGSTVSNSQAGTTYAVTSAVDGDVFAVDARDGAGNVSSLTSGTFNKPSGGGRFSIGGGIH